MKEEKKQLKELSEEDLKKVNGGTKTNFTVTVATIKGYTPGDPAGFFFQTTDTTEDKAKQ